MLVNQTTFMSLLYKICQNDYNLFSFNLLQQYDAFKVKMIDSDDGSRFDNESVSKRGADESPNNKKYIPEQKFESVRSKVPKNNYANENLLFSNLNSLASFNINSGQFNDKAEDNNISFDSVNDIGLFDDNVEEQNEVARAQIVFYDAKRNMEVKKVVKTEDEHYASAQMNKEVYNIKVQVEVKNCLVEDFYQMGKKDNYNLESVDMRKLAQKIKVIKKHEDEYSLRDIVLHEGKIVNMTNSVVYFLNNFLDKSIYWYKTEIYSRNDMSLETQNYQCFFCLKKIQMSWIFGWNNAYWCSYFLRFCCKDCISNEFCILPGYILKEWNFSLFSVSKLALSIIKEWYDKPNIKLKGTEKIVKYSFMLQSMIILKQKIHKVFDLMKCSSKEHVVERILGDKVYLLMKENFFSLKDLFDLDKNHLLLKLGKLFDEMQKHILEDCKECHYSGGKCMVCLSDNKIFAYDIEKAFFCTHCRNLFHKKCSSVHPCWINK